MSTMTRTTAYAVLSRAVAAQRNGSAPEQVARLDAALAVAGEVLLAWESSAIYYEQPNQERRRASVS